MKRAAVYLIVCLLAFSLIGCGIRYEVKTTGKETITVAAAASLKNCLDKELIPMFKEKYPNIGVLTTYDSSGKLQTQIEEGASVDVFMSAAMKQMNALNEKGLILEDSIVHLLENKIVLILPAGSDLNISKFEDVLQAEQIGLGDPDSVPAGQYAKEALVNLNLWDQVAEKASLGTNVTEVLNWVAEGSADAGFVYSTDAASNAKVIVAAEAPEGSVSKVIYPVGIVKATEHEEAAKTFIEFLQSEEAIKVFESYGFTAFK
jgi:molybdate transport system substrate-binding protein